MDDDQTVERVARAIRDAACNRSRKGRDFEHLPPAAQEAWRLEARAAILAVREG